jgi:hypothetical protein
MRLCPSPFSDSANQSALEKIGVKFTPGGAHISRTMMLPELEILLGNVPDGADTDCYREAIVERNILSKTTDSTRQKTLRHLKELYALNERVPLFRLLRKLHGIDPLSLPLLAVQIAWARDTLFRATSEVIFDSSEGDRLETEALEQGIQNAYPGHYSDTNKIARNAASSWTQSGHLSGRNKKIRTPVKSTPAATTMALLLGATCGFHGTSVFSSPWCRLLDLTPDKARSAAQEAHRRGLLNLRCIADVVELDFPMFPEFSTAP